MLLNTFQYSYLLTNARQYLSILLNTFQYSSKLFNTLQNFSIHFLQLYHGGVTLKMFFATPQQLWKLCNALLGGYLLLLLTWKCTHWFLLLKLLFSEEAINQINCNIVSELFVWVIVNNFFSCHFIFYLLARTGWLL